MSYELFILRRAQKEITALERQDMDRITKEIRKLAKNPRPSGCRKLTARDGWRIKSGSLRIIYEIDDSQQTITVFHVGHLRDVYR